MDNNPPSYTKLPEKLATLTLWSDGRVQWEGDSKLPILVSYDFMRMVPNWEAQLPWKLIHIGNYGVDTAIYIREIP